MRKLSEIDLENINLRKECMNMTMVRLSNDVRNLREKVRNNNRLIKVRLKESYTDFKVGDIFKFKEWDENGNKLEIIHLLSICGYKSVKPNEDIEIVKVNNKSININFTGYDGNIVTNINITKERMVRLILEYTDLINQKTLERDEELEELIK